MQHENEAEPEELWYVWRQSSREIIGPFPTSEVRRWITEGVLGHGDQVSRGRSDPWRAPGIVAEFGDPERPFGGPPEAPTTATGTGIGNLSRDQIAAALLGILLGTFGAHHFYNGNTKLGVVYLLVSLLSFGLLAIVPAVLGIVEGVLYLTATQADFYARRRNFLLRPSE